MSESRTIPFTVAPTPSSGSCCGGSPSSASGACCGGDARETLAPGADPRTAVRENYGRVAVGDTGACGCTAAVDPEAVLERIGYTAEQAAAIPEGANLGLGCGNPVEHAALRPGEVVLDLGSGGGIDCFLAAREVGPTGRAIGVDMTPPMLERARAVAAKHGATNVEFRLGEIEHLPVADASVDCVISNCVVNLSPAKADVFREALRVLRPGGRLVVSDLVLVRPLDPDLRHDVALYVGCVAGAEAKDDYLRLVREAGFDRVEVLSESGYDVGTSSLPEGSREREAFASVVSLKLRAWRP